MFFKFYFIFVALIMSTNAGGPSENMGDLGPSEDLALKERSYSMSGYISYFINSLRDVVIEYEDKIKRLIDDYAANNLSSDEFEKGIQDIIDYNFNELLNEIATYSDGFAGALNLPDKKDIFEYFIYGSETKYSPCLYDKTVNSAYKSVISFINAYGNEIISKH